MWVELGLLLLWELWNLGLWSFPVYSRPSISSPHADRGGESSQAPSGLQSQKSCHFGLSARGWPASLIWTVRTKLWLYICPQAARYICAARALQKWRDYGFRKCLPRWCLWALPSPLALWRWCVTEPREIFKEKKETNVWFSRWKRRIRKEMAGGEGEGKEYKCISSTLWFVWGPWGQE